MCQWSESNVCLFIFLPPLLPSFLQGEKVEGRVAKVGGGAHPRVCQAREKSQANPRKKKKGRGKKKKSITRNSTLDRENPDQNII